MSKWMMTHRTNRTGLVLVFAVLGAISCWRVYGQEKKQLRSEYEVLPSAEAILDKYVEVTGGKAAYSRLHTQHLEGTVKVGSGSADGRFTSDHAGPANSLEVVSFGLLQTVRGTNGEVAWQKSGPLASLGSGQGRLREYGERDLALLLARFNADAGWRDLFSKAETAAVENVNGSECYRIDLTVKDGLGITGGLRVTKYYDKQSGLLVKIAMLLKVPKTDPAAKAPLEFGEMPWELILGDYRKERDVLVSHQMIERVGGRQPITTTIEQVDWNASISRRGYDLPDDIRALLAGKKSQ